jgi:hypothetical protein
VDKDLPRPRRLVCDACWEEHAVELTIIPGDHVVVARCGSSGTYGNPREFAEARLGGRKGAYSGRCPACAGEAGR